MMSQCIPIPKITVFSKKQLKDVESLWCPRVSPFLKYGFFEKKQLKAYDVPVYPHS